METPEQTLIDRSREGDLEAFAALVRLHQGAIRAYLAVRLGDKDEADDLAQEVFVTAFKRLETLESGQPLGAWLRRIALNHYRNHRRKFRPMPIGGSEDLQQMLDEGVEAQIPDLAESDAVAALRDCLDTVEGPSRTLLHERYVAGHSVRELAARTNRGYSALTMQLHRTRTLLADCIRLRLPSFSTR